MYNTPQVQGFFFPNKNVSFLHKKLRNFFLSSVKFVAFNENLKKIAKKIYMKKWKQILIQVHCLKVI